MQPVKKWRLKKTLRRGADYRPIESADVKYLWAAYKQGALAPMGEMFADGSMSAEDFRKSFEAAVTQGIHACWTLFAMTRKGFIPVGIVFCRWANAGTYLEVIGIAFLPWASKRNIIEATVNFFRMEGVKERFVGYATPEHEKLYIVCCQHGIMRKIGVSYVVIPRQRVSIFETKDRDRME